MANEIQMTPRVPQIIGSQIRYFMMGTFVINGKQYMVRPILKEDVEAVELLSEDFKKEEAMKMVNRWIELHQNRCPWSAYVIRDSDCCLIGIWRVERVADPNILHLSRHLLQRYQKKGITEALWKWTVYHLLKPLHDRGIGVLISAIGKEIPLTQMRFQLSLDPKDDDRIKKVMEEGFKEEGMVMVLNTVRHIYRVDVEAILRRAFPVSGSL